MRAGIGSAHSREPQGIRKAFSQQVCICRIRPFYVRVARTKASLQEEEFNRWEPSAHLQGRLTNSEQRETKESEESKISEGGALRRSSSELTQDEEMIPLNNQLIYFDSLI